MPVKRRAFLFLVVIGLAIAFFINQRLQHADSADKLETLVPSSRIQAPVPVIAEAPARPSGAVESPDSSTTTSQQFVVEPDTVVVPEVSELKKSIAWFALQEFGKVIGLDLRAPFSIEDSEVSSIADGVLKFHGSAAAGEQSLTVLSQKGGQVRSLTSVYAADLDLKPEQLKSEEAGGVITTSVADPEGEHLFVSTTKGDRAYLIALVRKQPAFTPAEINELQLLLRTGN